VFVKPMRDCSIDDFNVAGQDWAAWHLPGGPVGPPARWAASSNVEVGLRPTPLMV